MEKIYIRTRDPIALSGNAHEIRNMLEMKDIKALGDVEFDLQSFKELDPPLEMLVYYDDNILNDVIKLLKENDIDCKKEKSDEGPKNCLIDFLLDFVVSNDLLTTVGISIFSNFIYDQFQGLIVRFVKNSKTSKNVGCIRIKAVNNELVVKSNKITEAAILKSLDVFKEICLNDSYSEDAKYICPNEETGEVDIMDLMEYNLSYVPKSVMNKVRYE